MKHLSRRAIEAATRTALIVLLAAPPAHMAATADVLDDYVLADTEQLRDEFRAQLPAYRDAGWVQDPEARVSPELDARELWTQTYSVRFKPVGRKERAIASKLFAIENELTSRQWDSLLEREVVARYTAILDLARLEIDLAFATRHHALEQTMLDAQRSLAATTDYREARVIDAAIKLQSHQDDIDRLRRQTQLLRAMTVDDYLAVPDGEEPRVSPRIIDPEAIENRLQELIPLTRLESTRRSQAALELELAQYQMLLEKRRSGLGLSLMELSYENKGVDSYNVTVGIRLPFSQRQGETERRARNLLEAKSNVSRINAAADSEAQVMLNDLRLSLEAYASYTEKLQRHSQLVDVDITDAAAIANLRRRELDLLDGAATEHINAMRFFIRLLERTGKLRSTPHTNWLTGGSL